MTPSRGIIRLVALVALAVSAFLGLQRFLAARTVLAPTIAATPLSQVSPQVCAATLLRLDLDPSALAAAGIAPEDVGLLVAAVKEALGEEPEAIALLDTAAADARVNRQRLERLIQAGLASPEDVPAYPSAVQLQQTADLALDTALEAIHGAATASLPESARAALATVRANRRTWDSVAVAFLVAERSEPDWVSLRDALAAQRIAAATEEPLEDVAQQVISTASADLAVQTAISNAQNQGDAIAQAWSAAVE